MQFSLSALGYLRVAVVSPELKVGDVAFNVEQMSKDIERAVAAQCQFLVFPEMSVTGYTCGDLFYQNTLVERAREGLWQLAACTRQHPAAIVVGVPIMLHGRLFNCAAFLAGGKILGIVPKTYLPNTVEFYEKRWFCSEFERDSPEIIWHGETIPFGADLLFRVSDRPEFIVGVEICEDLWAPHPPSTEMAVAGATLLVNLSASDELWGKCQYRRDLVQSQSARCIAAYAYAGAGPCESTTDVVFAGHSIIAENGTILAQTKRLEFTSEMAMSDVDLEHMANDRSKNSTFTGSYSYKQFRFVSFPLSEVHCERLLRPVSATPFVPTNSAEKNEACREIFAIQTTALARRLKAIACRHAVIGISGGLDSTLALLVTAKAFDKFGLDRRGIVAITMPGFGTTQRTKNNAEKLAELLGTSLQVIPIGPAVEQHFRDIAHDANCHDITYENCQARERMQILMDVANQVGGIVIGTGDLSELALGWCTYNGDHMSMYAVNVGVPKTLVCHLVEWCAQGEFSGQEAAVLRDITETPVSPELLPPDANGQISQITEEKIGPYLLHDFFLYYAVRMQFTPNKIFMLAQLAFAGHYRSAEILRWLKVFYQRFFAQQFKRSCLPDGPKVGSVALSPRSDWRMPSDASAALWLAEVDKLA
jgi:NAD+ synthase (glutamine-hydrolysing)